MGLITIVRHGQASFGSDNYDQLSDVGMEQSRVLGEHLKHQEHEFDSVYSGSLERHKQTLDGILQAYSIKHSPEIDANLNEFEFKSVIKAYLVHHKRPFPDKSTPRVEYYRLLKNAMLSWQTGELDYLEMTESWLAFFERTTSAMNAIARNRAKHTLIVTSGGVLGAILKSVLNAPDATAIELNLQIRNASVTQFFVGKSGVSLSEFNNVSCFQSQDTKHLITYS